MGDGEAVIPAPLADALAAYRLTRLVTADVILDGPRDAVVRWAYRHRDHDISDTLPGDWAGFAMDDPHSPKLATLLTCRWCAGFYCALFVVAARRYAPRLWDPLAQALAMSAGAALLARLED